MYEDPKSKISQLEKILDAREDRVSGKVKRHGLQDHDYSINQDWEDNKTEVGGEIFGAPEKTKNSFFAVKILIGSIIFFLIALLVVLYRFMGGGNVVSGNNIEVNVKAPVSVAGGEVLPFEVEIKNNNSVTLLGADLGITFPPGAQDITDTSQPAKKVQQYIGDVLPGQSIKKNFSVVLYGSENEKKDINITLEYKVTGSNSLFNKAKIVSVLVSSAPVTIVVSGPTSINTNQKVDFTVDVTSNSPSLIKNLLLKVDYPFGFSFTGSNPATFSQNNFWLVGDLAPGAKRTIKFSGALSGQEGEERGFNFSLGSQSKTDTLVIGVPFAASFSSVTIKRPFVSADIFFDKEDTLEYVSSAGSKVDTSIRWKNNLPYEVSDVAIVVKINGNAVNKSSIQVDSGYYKSSDNTITFNKTTDSSLAILEPGQSGDINFGFNSFGTGSVTGAGLTNPTIVLNFLVTGRRLDYAGGSADDILFSDVRKVKITTNPQLFAKALYYVGPFQNSGPIPPKAEQETTYTITWTVVNPLNNLTNTLVTATLPPYVKWLAMVSPDKEKIDYDSSTGLLVWNVGNIPAGAGVVSPAREVSFQVSLLPSVNQIGTPPNLIGETTINAKDSFTLTAVSNSFLALNTRLTSDPYFKVSTETVIK